MNERDRGPIKVEIVEHFGVLSTAPTGWTKEFNLVKWNDRPEKYDIRDWSPGHERMSKGVTLFDYEMKKIAELCIGLFDDYFVDNQAAQYAGQPAVSGSNQTVPAEQQIAGSNSSDTVPAEGQSADAGDIQTVPPDENLSMVAEEAIPF